MIRIFLPLSLVSSLLLILAFAWGVMIDDARSVDFASQRQVSHHMLLAVGGLLFASLVHALVLTYFMGTGRWLEETGAAYKLPSTQFDESKRMKYRVIPAMIGAFGLLLAAGALGAVVDPGSPAKFDGFAGLTGAQCHFWLAAAAVAFNMLVNCWEFSAIERNGELIEQVLAEVRRIRTERGLAV